jgi:hypothetical protein
MENGSPDLVQQSSASSPTKSRSKTRDKRSKKKRKDRSPERGSTPEDKTSPILVPVAKKQKQVQPLKGIVLSVSTLKEGQSDAQKSDKSDDSATGYNAVCKLSKDMGAQVTGQVSKRVQLLICTRSAVSKATQRVRKAYKKKIPLVDVSWLEACREAGGSVDTESFRLEAQAKDAIAKRESNLGDDINDPAVDVPPDAGWTESLSYGCSCVCHENGAEKDCQWCSNGCNA